jgi:hypothetical protein
MQKRQDSVDSAPCPTSAKAPKQGLEDMGSVLKIFRNSARTAAERPDLFWKKQRETILRQLSEPDSVRWPRRVLAWSTVVLAVLFCLFFFAQPSKAPTPDLPGGADQNLLIEVEKELRRECPEALMPAAVPREESRILGKMQ